MKKFNLNLDKIHVFADLTTGKRIGVQFRHTQFLSQFGLFCVTLFIIRFREIKTFCASKDANTDL